MGARYLASQMMPLNRPSPVLCMIRVPNPGDESDGMGEGLSYTGRPLRTHNRGQSALWHLLSQLSVPRSSALKRLVRLLLLVRDEQASELHHVTRNSTSSIASVGLQGHDTSPRPTLVRSVRTQNRKHSQQKHSPWSRVPVTSPRVPPVQTSIPDSTIVRTWVPYSPC